MEKKLLLEFELFFRDGKSTSNSKVIDIYYKTLLAKKYGWSPDIVDNLSPLDLKLFIKVIELQNGKTT